ncbi:terminase large subunit domain-containing protein [Dysgonomonas sp. BGC7]|uniref:terminase large subunit domain-containing protein n=1 Tax=Dysgonomonas sp. BGC7 TaxID=1658008 RepID=UPI000680B5FB|nr:terminase family protein [Dysgonomonas sp. BGC7]MBD8389652.1 hypothetical protein [Dysgonomonas sp. BGC7]
MAEIRINKIRPQDGYQMMALSSPADIVIGGGAAGVGKTFTLLLEPLRHKDVKGFGAVIFRRTTPQIRSEGGLWDASKKLYSYVFDARSKESSYEWHFGDRSKLKFSHLEYEKNIYDWQGSEIPMIGFDELTHFSKKMFFYMLSRNRSTCGVIPYVRATCNPDPDSWVYELISWWIDPNTGLPIPERKGIVRYFVRDGESYIWGDTKDEVIEKARYYLEPMVESSKGLATYDNFIKSITFIGGSIYDNVELLSINPEYLGNLASLSEEEKARLLLGSWKPIISDNDVYDYYAFRDIFSNSFVSRGERRIVVDVAGEGNDKLAAGFFEGHRLEDIEIYDKTTGKDVIDLLLRFKVKHKVRNSNILYDADGVGFFIGGEKNGFIQGSIPFHNGGKAIDTGDNRTFANLKTQCYIYSGERAARGESYISEHVANKMYDEKNTIRQQFMLERKAIKKQTKKDEEATRLIPKDEMKQKYLNGESPNLLDMYMMNEWFELNNSLIKKPSTYKEDE